MVDKYLICSDIDGTLMTNHQEISKNTLYIINKLQEQGHLFYVATGRMFLSANAVASGISSKTGVIGSNGGVYSIGNEIITNSMNKESSILTYKIAMKYQLPLFFFSQDAVYYSLILPDYFKDETDQGRVDSGGQKAYFKINNELELLKYADQFINAIIISDDQLEQLELAKKELSNDLKLTVTSSYYNNIEISPQDISKAIAIKELQTIHNISKSRTIVLGDGGNDIEMFKVADISVAMANASDEVKKAAKFKTNSNNEEGVYYFLKKYFSEKEKENNGK